ncbi:hypothetical protein Csa_023611, partial [Cucumis sativus]
HSRVHDFCRQNVLNWNIEGNSGDRQVWDLCYYTYRSHVHLCQQQQKPAEIHGQMYPPEGPRPPSPEEVREMARELARKNNIR